MKLFRKCGIRLLLATALPGAVWPQTTASQSGLSTASAVQLHVLRFRLKLHAIAPSAATIPAGSYAIDLINGVILAPLTVQLSDSTGNVLQQAAGTASSSRIRNVYALTPGTYTIGVRSRPEWSAKITVTKD